MAQLALQILGGFAISRVGGSEIALRGKKGRALLAYLALSGKRRHAREALATLLWSDRGDEQGRSSLRQTLLTLRRALEDRDGSLLISDGDQLVDKI